jgi:tRNA(fMet)-specific endonuclease VapC
MKYLLDSNVWISVLRKHTGVRRRLANVLPQDVFLSTPVVAELAAGAWKSDRPRENLSLLNDLLYQYDCLYFGVPEALRYAELFEEMRSGGTPVGTLDLQIAATASVHGLTVVTHNVGNFERIPKVDLEDWQV